MKTMKKTRFSRIAALLIALTLVVGALFSVSIAANAADTEPSLGYANVQFGDIIKLAFTINGNGTGIAVYSDAEGTELLSTDTVAKVDDNITYYTTKGIPAKDIDTVYYVGVIDADGEVGKLSPYSVLKYIESMESSADEAQLALYAKIKAYNAAADAVLGE